jgi:hypothetical protein
VPGPGREGGRGGGGAQVREEGREGGRGKGSSKGDMRRVCSPGLQSREGSRDGR